MSQLGTKLKELIFKVQNESEHKKWKNLDVFKDYIEDLGGCVKNDKKRRKGYVVSHLYTEKKTFRPIVVELPKEFVEKALILGGLP